MYIGGPLIARMKILFVFADIVPHSTLQLEASKPLYIILSQKLLLETKGPARTQDIISLIYIL